MDTRLRPVRTVSGEEQRRVPHCEAIFVPDGDVHVRTCYVGTDDDRRQLSGLSAVRMDLW